VNLASRGLRDLDRGPQQIDDVTERSVLRQQGQKVLVESVAWAAVLTAAAVAAPHW